MIFGDHVRQVAHGRTRDNGTNVFLLDVSGSIEDAESGRSQQIH